MQFIKATDRYSSRAEHVAAPIFRRTFDLSDALVSARLEIAVSGFYELYVNGENITSGLLAPYITNPDQLIYKDSYDVAPYLKAGKNAVAVILGNGFANQDVTSWNFDTASCRGPLKLALELTLKTESGENVISSDESFKVATSPILFDMYRYGVIYDAREEREGFATPEYDDSDWQSAKFTDAPRGEIRPSSHLPIRIREELSPVSIEHREDFYTLYYKSGEPMKECYVKEGWVYDFGINTSGVCRLKIKGERGQRIVIRHAERLLDGRFDIGTTVTIKEDTPSTIGYLQTDVYYLKGGEEEIFFPPFTYHGFRYALVEGITEEQATPELLTYAVFNTDVKKRSHFECSDKVLNKLYAMTINADLSNFHHFPTDCPHREKNGWTGDVAASAEQLLLAFGCRENLRAWLDSLRAAQLDSGMLPGIAPTTGWGYAWGNGPFWDQAAVVVPYFIYKYDGDLRALSENADMIARYVRYISSRRDESGLVAVGLGDWVEPGSVGRGFLAPLVLTDSVTVYDVADKAEHVFHLLGRAEDEAFAQRLKCEMRSAIREHLIDRESATAEGACQTSQALLLYFSLFEKEDTERAYSRLIEIIEADGRHLTTGVIGLRYIFEVLIGGGDVDLALELITRPDEPSYGAMIERGATALCESLDVNGLNESENHHFLGDILRVFTSLIAGLRVNPDSTDKDTFLFAPSVPSSLNYARAEYDFATGRLTCGWERCDGAVRFYADVPEGVRGSLRLGHLTQELTPGKNEFTV